MSDYTCEEIEEAVEKLEDGWHTLHELPWMKYYFELRGESILPEIVEDHGGGEGSGEERWVVFKVKEQLFRKEGYYASHYGTDWDGPLFEVEPVERTVTFYEQKK